MQAHVVGSYWSYEPEVERQEAYLATLASYQDPSFFADEETSNLVEGVKFYRSFEAEIRGMEAALLAAYYRSMGLEEEEVLYHPEAEVEGGVMGAGGTEPGYPSTEPGYPSTEPGYPSAEPGYPSAEPGYPSTEPGYPSTEHGYPSTGAGGDDAAPHPHVQQGRAEEGGAEAAAELANREEVEAALAYTREGYVAAVVTAAAKMASEQWGQYMHALANQKVDT